MANYEGLSRRGLINLNHDFDKDNNNMLKEYLGDNEAGYEEIHPYEEVIDRMGDVSDALQDRMDTVSKSMVFRLNNVFDSLVESIKDEVDRCEQVLDEQEDNASYPDDHDSEEE